MILVTSLLKKFQRRTNFNVGLLCISLKMLLLLMSPKVNLGIKFINEESKEEQRSQKVLVLQKEAFTPFSVTASFFQRVSSKEVQLYDSLMTSALV